MGFDQWKVIHSEIPFHQRYIRVRRDELESPDGERTDYVYLEDEIPGTVTVIAITDDGRIPLVKQYRLPIQSYQFNLPGGIIDQGENPLQGAQRELREETGISADDWTYIGSYHPMASHHTRKAHLFIAKGLHFGERNLDPFEDLEVEFFQMGDLLNAIQTNQMNDMELIYGILLAKEKGFIKKEG